MAANFPTNLPATKTDYDGNDEIASSIINSQAVEINALGTKVGIDSSAVTTSHDFKLSGVTGTDKAVSKTGEETLTNKTLTSPIINQFGTASGLGAAWTAYTPSLYKNDGTTALSGTIGLAKYTQIGKTVIISFVFTAMANPGGTQIFFTLPVATKSETINQVIGAGYTVNGTTTLVGMCYILANTTTKGTLYYGAGSAWGASGNAAVMTVSYEAA
jgi:hypothetical protein